ncbi:hypothetical protein ACFL3G_01405 [Planctomycetota bacterium]
MHEHSDNTVNSLKRVVAILAVEKKKAVIALSLMVLMVTMWVRLLSNNSPNSAIAQPAKQDTTESDYARGKTLAFVELPKVKGRNNFLTRDIFVVDGKGLSRNSSATINSDGNDEQYSKKLAGKLSLDAIVLGQKPHAFINNKLLSAGDKFIIGDDENAYEYEVISVEKKAVLVKCGEIEITLKLNN